VSATEVLKYLPPQEIPASITNELIRERDLAQQLQVHIMTLRRWHAQGIGPSRVSVGRQRYYRRSAVLNWLEQHQEQGIARRRKHRR
jgi:predicted DNA-binding transcriptional regulator AlpA